ncbi:MAG TPA: molybdopterin cofactor-binding domain-containing protein, partial [Gemmatimonadota bacterium]|nr:molybdopterin cofactor-binding domain-containing protein [Gemmatimonadota bacterium]
SERDRDAGQVFALDRRDFVKLGALAGGGLVLGVAFPGRLAAWETAAGAAGADGAGAAAAGLQPGAFVRVGTDGRVTIWMARAEMGQGVLTALPMLVADELDADWDAVEIVQAGADPDKYGRQMTVGSSSVRGGAWLPLRKAGAAARAMLVAAAAERWGVPAAACSTSKGRVTHGASGRSAGYGELAEEAASLPVPRDAPLKDPSEFTLIGTSPPRRDTHDKVTGKAAYGADVRVEGMLQATVVRPPPVAGSLGSFDPGGALAVAGVRKVVPISAGLAVVADHTWAAFQGAEALEAEWKDDGFAMDSKAIAARLDGLLEAKEAAVARDDGDVAGALSAGAHRLQARYVTPYLAHATMEPMVTTARVTDGACEVWASTQNPQGAQRLAADICGLDVSDVTVHVTFVGCGWGRRGSVDYVRDAVETAKAIGGGTPVQVVWTREEDMRHDEYRPISHYRLEGAVDGKGRLSAFDCRVAAPPIGVQDGRGSAGRVDRNAVDGIANSPYAMLAIRVDYRHFGLPVPTGYWRSVGPSGNTWVLESFVDELAHAAGRDPLEFRLEMLGGEPRVKHVLQVAAERAGWGKPLPEGRARGIGLVRDKGGRVAEIAEVSSQDGRPRLHRVTVVADCGQVVHPGIVEQQMSGSVVAGLAAALYGKITLDGGRVVQGNFDGYPLLRISE